MKCFSEPAAFSGAENQRNWDPEGTRCILIKNRCLVEQGILEMCSSRQRYSLASRMDHHAELIERLSLQDGSRLEFFRSLIPSGGCDHSGYS